MAQTTQENTQMDSFTEFTGDGTYHAGNFDAEDLPQGKLNEEFPVGEGEQADVDAEFADMTRDLVVGGSTIARGVRKDTFSQANIIDDERSAGQEREMNRSGGRKPINKK
ncbi:hypothetical protein KC973_02260 [Candidatus Saccharibacteria bacterium]|nr:hypothetical protein [Candidatus Saccharibacteria bacterium]